MGQGTVSRFNARAFHVLLVSVVVMIFITPSAKGAPRFCTDDAVANRQGVSVGEGHVALIASNDSFEPGAVVYARLLNFSKRLVGYGAEFTIQKFDLRSGWIRDSASPPGPWSKVEYLLPPGAAGRCFRFKIPSSQQRGRYRFLKKVDLRLGVKGREARLSTEFRVG